jgi:hypothetical protein
VEGGEREREYVVKIKIFKGHEILSGNALQVLISL